LATHGTTTLRRCVDIVQKNLVGTLDLPSKGAD
jgi:hypothetical protein